MEVFSGQPLYSKSTEPSTEPAPETLKQMHIEKVCLKIFTAWQSKMGLHHLGVTLSRCQATGEIWQEIHHYLPPNQIVGKRDCIAPRDA